MPDTFSYQMPEESWVINVAHFYTLLKKASLCKTQAVEERGQDSKLLLCFSSLLYSWPKVSQSTNRRPKWPWYHTSLLICQLPFGITTSTGKGTLLIFKGMTLSNLRAQFALALYIKCCINTYSVALIPTTFFAFNLIIFLERKIILHKIFFILVTSIEYMWCVVFSSSHLSIHPSVSLRAVSKAKIHMLI